MKDDVLVYNHINLILYYNSSIPWNILDKHVTTVYNIFMKIYDHDSCKLSITELYNYYKTNIKYYNRATFDMLFDYLLSLVIDRSMLWVEERK